MKTAKILILLTISSLLITLLGAVTAVDETKTLNDFPDDVVYVDPITGNETIADRPNIDIEKVHYVRTGTTVTITLSVYGAIENRGNLNDILDQSSSDFNLDLVMYSVTLSTSGDIYSITYVNNVCNFSTSELSMNITDFTVHATDLTFSFDITNQSETYDSLSAITMDAKISASVYEIYTDETNDIPLEVSAGESYEGSVGETITFYGGAMGGVTPYSWNWDFGDGSTSTETYPTHAYTEAKTYTATVTVTDRNGATADSTATVSILSGQPNGDGPHTNGGIPTNILIFAVVLGIIIIVGVVTIVYVLRR